MDIKQISQDVGRGDLNAAEQAYCTIVAYPNAGPIDGANVSSLYATMVQICGALSNDVGTLPAETCKAAEIRPGSTYAEGAADFRAHRGPWMHRFQATMAGF